MNRPLIPRTSHEKKEESPDSSEKLRRFGLSAVASATVAVSAVSIEALSALPPTAQKDVPSSLRCSSLVLVALLASPPIDEGNEHSAVFNSGVSVTGFEFEQRGILMLLLILVSVFGENHGDEAIRVADATFVLLSGWSIVMIFIVRSTRPTRASTLSGSFLFYVGARIIKSAFNHSAEVTTFVVSSDQFDTRGYGLSDSVSSTALAFGGSTVACAGALILANDRAIQKHGCQFTSPVVAQLAGVAFTAALVAQLSQYSHLDDLSVLFSTSSCGGSGCDAARRARRLYVANSSTGALWAAVVSLTLFATPKNRRAATPRDYYDSNPIPTVGGIICAAMTVLIVAASLHFSNHDFGYVTTELVVLYLSIPVVWFLSAPLGCVLFTAGNAMYVRDRLGSALGFDLRYWTHWSLATSGILASLLFVTTSLTWAIFHLTTPLGKRPSRIDVLERATCALTIALFSIQMALTVTTLVLFASYDGTLVTNENSWREQGFEYSLQHSLSFFFAAALYGSRFELAEMGEGIYVADDNARLSTRARHASFYILPVATLLLWAVTVATSEEGSPYGTSTSIFPFVVGVVASVVPWFVTGIGI